MAELRRTASAVWTGSLREGTGTASVPSGVLRDAPITFASRFESGTDSNPEELIAAAHAACFSMALSAALTQAGTPPAEIRTTATVTLTLGEGGPRITAVHLDTEGRVAGIDAATFLAAAEGAKAGCPVSKLLAPGLEQLTLAARFVG
jgi:lipoyl-dependent peroxiredoxin